MRIVWFGFIIQTLLLILVIEIFLCDMTIAYGLQISIFATLATVFAVIGVDQNIYLSQPAAKAVGAGWLLTAIVNLIWIIYFTSPPESPFLRVADIINAPGPSRPPTMIHTVEKIGRSQDAFLMSPQGANSVHKGLNVDAGDQGNVSRADRAHTGEANPSSLTASNQWNLYQRPARDTLSASAARSERSGPREQSMVMSDHGSARPDSGAAGDVVLQPIPAPIDSHVQTWKAQALFDCTFSLSILVPYQADTLPIIDNGSPDDPNELIFKKHEILVITDKSGKWWEATASDGRKGSMFTVSSFVDHCLTFASSRPIKLSQTCSVTSTHLTTPTLS